MFDLGWSEMMIVGVLALIIIGPKDLPKLFKQLSYWVRQLRGMAGEFQSGINEMVREADLEDAKKMFDSAQEFNPKNQFKNLIDPDQTLEKDLDIEAEFNKNFESGESMLFQETGSDEPEPVVEAPTKQPAKKTAKKTAAKKTTPKKSAVAKTATKKPAAKKEPAKKADTKKTAAKKPVAKKTVTKPVAKKPATKQTTAKSTTKTASSKKAKPAAAEKSDS